MIERERNRRQARKSRTLKKQCTDKMQEQLTQLHKEAVSVTVTGNTFFFFLCIVLWPGGSVAYLMEYKRADQ